MKVTFETLRNSLKEKGIEKWGFPTEVNVDGESSPFIVMVLAKKESWKYQTSDQSSPSNYSQVQSLTKHSSMEHIATVEVQAVSWDVNRFKISRILVIKE